MVTADPAAAAVASVVNPGTHILVVGTQPAATPPANVRFVEFDQAGMAYLAGALAALEAPTVAVAEPGTSLAAAFARAPRPAQGRLGGDRRVPRRDARNRRLCPRSRLPGRRARGGGDRPPPPRRSAHAGAARATAGGGRHRDCAQRPGRHLPARGGRRGAARGRDRVLVDRACGPRRDGRPAAARRGHRPGRAAPVPAGSVRDRYFPRAGPVHPSRPVRGRRLLPCSRSELTPGGPRTPQPELRQVEAETAIRTRYINALEDERFDILPGPTYTKGFLRAYAEYLGLDGNPTSTSSTPAITTRARRPSTRRSRHAALAAAAASTASGASRTSMLVTLAGIVAVSVLVILACSFPSPPIRRRPTPTPGTTKGTRRHPPPSTPVKPPAGSTTDRARRPSTW